VSTSHPDPAVREEMDPADVDGELVDDAVDAWHETPRPMLLDDQMRHILAAVLPEHEKQVRAKVAEEIFADVAVLFVARLGADTWEAAHRAAWIARDES
jgi:hypothetical protein